MKSTKPRHGHAPAKSRSPTYKSWTGAKHRCKSEHPSNFKSYRAKGISFSPKWDKFPDFLADMGERPKGTSLDRIDPNGNYEPGNCRWATGTTQGRNKTSNVLLTLSGEVRCMSEWAEELGLPYFTLCWRIRQGWSHEKALTTPVRTRREK
jgi:hypothetical protein